MNEKTKNILAGLAAYLVLSIIVGVVGGALFGFIVCVRIENATKQTFNDGYRRGFDAGMRQNAKDAKFIRENCGTVQFGDADANGIVMFVCKGEGK